MADNPFEIENKTGDGIEAPHGGNTTPARLNLANLAIDGGDTFTRSKEQTVVLRSDPTLVDTGISDKLARQASVLGGGILDGTAASLKDAVHDPSTILKAGASFGLGVTLTYLGARQGKARIAAQGAGLALGGLFAKDLYDHGAQAGAILSDSWNNPQNYEANRAQMAHTLGPLVSDTLLYSAGGLGGVKFAHSKLGIGQGPSLMAGSDSGFKMPEFEFFKAFKSGKVEAPGKGGAFDSRSLAAAVEKPAPKEVEFLHRDIEVRGFENEALSVMKLPADAPLAQAVSRSRNAVGKIEALSYSDEGLGGSTATAVAISKDGKLVTNQHQVENALSLTVYDPVGNPHSAHVLKTGTVNGNDLAIIQLDRPSSYKAFEPVNLVDRVPEENSMLAFLGHSEGLNSMHVSRGSFASEWRSRNHLFKCNANVAGGNCGSAVVDMKGDLLGVMKGDMRGGGREATAIPSRYIQMMLESAEAPRSNTVTSPTLAPEAARTPIKTTYEVTEPERALKEVESIFGFRGSNYESDFFHQRARRVQIEDGGKEATLFLNTSINRNSGEVTVRPVAIDGVTIPQGKPWQGTDIPMSSAELRLRPGQDGRGLSLESVNDPLGLLTRGLELKGGQESYLSTLKPLATEPLAVKPIESVAPAKAGADKTKAGSLSRFLMDYSLGATANGLKITSDSLAR